MTKRILLTGGGTGGHIYPLIAVAEALKEQPIEIKLQYIGPANEYSARIKEVGIPVASIAHAKLRRYASLLNIIDGVKLIYAFFQALIKVAIFWPHAVFSKGGPGALPILIACRIYHVPIIIHESDTVPGLTNRISAPWARLIELGWGKARDYFPHMPTHIVGVPLRKQLLETTTLTAREAKKELGCNPEEPLLLVLGGSQGSQRINKIILDNVEPLIKEYQILHQTGAHNFKEYMQQAKLTLEKLPRELQNRYHPAPYLEDTMGAAYAAADGIISRSGSVVFEIAAFEKPSLVIPLPEAAHNHQKINAEEYRAAGCAIMIEEQHLSSARLIAACAQMIKNHEVSASMRESARAFAKPETAKIIAEDIVKIV